MSITISEQTVVASTVSQSKAPDAAGGTAPRSASDDFQEGPNFIEIASAIYQFLRKWSPRPWSIWHEQLVGEAWAPWKATIVVRLATVLWLLGSQLIFALMIVAVLAGLAVLFSP